MKKFSNHAVADALLRARLVTAERAAKAQSDRQREEPPMPVFTVADFERARQEVKKK